MIVHKTAQKTRRHFTLGGFGGVDFSSSPLTSAPQRATCAANWIGDHGINRKRRGWRQLCARLPGKINGIFPITPDVLLVYAGTAFFCMERESGERWSCTPCTTAADTGTLVNRRVQAFAAAEGLYIVGAGRYLIYTKEDNTVRPVSPFIPTTTVHIAHMGAENDVRTQKDLVNLLTLRRRNTLVGANGATSAAPITWQLDSDISSAAPVEVALEQTDGTVKTYRNVTVAESTYGAALFEEGDVNRTRLGSVDFLHGRISMILDSGHASEGYANVTVTFTPHTSRARFSPLRIHSATHGTLFGIGGARDRLFLAGDPLYPNFLFFSETDDFSYFPDQYTVALGTGACPISGFLPLFDTTLAVFQRSAVGTGAVHYLSGEYRFSHSEDGTLIHATPVFSVTAGASEESALNPYTCLSLSGDSLLVSEHGVFGITLSSNPLTDARTARERSHAISSCFSRFDAENAVAVSHGGKCYLSDGSDCFVADAAYTYTPEGCRYFNYEWWYWEHIPARVFACVGDELWFGTPDGRVCAFYDGYEDITFDDIPVGALGLEVKRGKESGALLYSNDALDGVLCEGQRLRLSLLGGGAFVRCAQSFDDVYEGEEIYLLGNGSLVPYTVLEVDRSAARFQLSDGSWYAPAEDSYYRRIDDRDVYVHTVDRAHNSFFLSLTPRSERVSVVNADGGTNPVARLFTDTPVRAYWETPPLAFGGADYEKTLFALTLTAESGAGGSLSLGYETRKGRGERTVMLAKPFSWETLDFSDLSFTNGFQTSHTLRVRERNFNFIRFRFESATPTPCAVHSICARYKINKYTKGVS